MFVRIPASQAHRLDARAHALGRTKQDMVREMLDGSLDALQGPEVREHHVKTHTDEVLTLAELAGLLKLEEDSVMARVWSGELPGRRFGDQWRFSRGAVLGWLNGIDAADRPRAGFSSSH